MAMQRGGPPPPPPPGPRPAGKAKAKPPSDSPPPPKPKPATGRGNDGMASVLGQLTGAIGPPKGSGGSDFNPSVGARPGYQKPEGLPENGGTLGCEKCFWSISGPQVATQQTLVTFKLICKNENKEPHDIATTLLETEMWRPDNKERTLVRGKFERTPEKGHYNVIFRPQQPGKFVFNIWVKGELEKKAIYADNKLVPLEVIKGPTLTETNIYFTASGHGFNGGQVGKEANFDIWSKDGAGEAQEIEDELLHVVIGFGPKKMAGHVERIGKGHYNATYTPWGAGEFDVVVQYGDEPIIKKVIKFTFGIDPSKTTIVNPPTQVNVGKQVSFKIQAKSQMGANINYGGQKFDCAVSGPPKGVQGLVVRDETDGTYTTRFTLIAPGSYKFFVKLGGLPINGSPFVVNAD